MLDIKEGPPKDQATVIVVAVIIRPCAPESQQAKTIMFKAFTDALHAFKDQIRDVVCLAQKTATQGIN